MPDFLPRGDAELANWAANFAAYAGANAAALGLAAGDVAPTAAASAAWNSALAAHRQAVAAAGAALQFKRAARADLERLVRPLARRLQASAAVDDGERAALGLVVPDRIPTPAGPPASAPIVRVDVPGRLRHRLRFSDRATPTRRARPAGALGAEVWILFAAAGDPAAADLSAYRFHGLATRSPFAVDLPAAAGGRTAHYVLRWINAKGEKGPWSATAAATVGE